MPMNAGGPSTASPPRDSSGDLRLIVLLLLLAIVPYANTLVNSFVYDDGKQVLSNPYVQSWRYLPEILGSNVWSFIGAAGVTNHYRPLMTLSYLICYQIFGPLPFGFHLVNVLLHVGTVSLVFRVSRQVFKNQTVAFVAGGLFAVHPIHTESVAWVGGVTDLQLAFFCLLTFSFFLRLGDAPNPGFAGLKAGATGAAMGASYVAALLAKEPAVMLPLLATLYEHFCRDDRTSTSTRQKLARYGPLWLLTIAYLIFRVQLLGSIAPILRRIPVTWPEALLSGCALAAQYVWKLLWPVELCAFYVFRKSESAAEPRVLGGIAVLMCVALLLVLLWRKGRRASFALVWIFLTLAPVLNARWMSANVFAERYLYLPSVGFCWLAAWAWTEAWQRASGRPMARRALVAGLCMVAALYAMRVVTRNRDWRGDEILYTQTLRVSPDSSIIRTNLGALYWNRGAEAAAMREWQEAYRLDPRHVVVLTNLGMLHSKKREYDQAEEFLRRALAMRPELADPHLHLARMYLEQGRAKDAEGEFSLAVKLAPLNVEARYCFGELLLKQGRLKEAEEQFFRSLESRQTADAAYGLGESYFQQGDRQRAQEQLERAVELDPYEGRAHIRLGQIYRDAGRAAEALREYEAVLQLDPRNERARAAVEELTGKTGSPQPGPRR